MLRTSVRSAALRRALRSAVRCRAATSLPAAPARDSVPKAAVKDVVAVRPSRRATHLLSSAVTMMVAADADERLRIEALLHAESDWPLAATAMSVDARCGMGGGSSCDSRAACPKRLPALHRQEDIPISPRATRDRFPSRTAIAAGAQGVVWRVTAQDGSTHALKRMLCLDERRLQQASHEAQVLRAAAGVRQLVALQACWVEPLTADDVASELAVRQKLYEDGSGDYWSEEESARESSARGSAFALCLQLSWAADGSLAAWLRRNDDSSGRSLLFCSSVLRDVCSALAGLHARRIVHRDVKPANILLHAGRAFLADCGHACMDMPGGQRKQAVDDAAAGTALYAAPELSTDGQPTSPAATAAADVFSLALVAVELLMPFKTVMERLIVLSAARRGRLPATLPHSAELAAALAPQPERRPTAAELLPALLLLTETLYA